MVEEAKPLVFDIVECLLIVHLSLMVVSVLKWEIPVYTMVN